MPAIPINQNLADEILSSQLTNLNNFNPGVSAAAAGYLSCRVPPPVLGSFSAGLGDIAVNDIGVNSYTIIPFVANCATYIVPVSVGSFSYFQDEWIGKLKVFSTGIFSVRGQLLVSGLDAGDEITIASQMNGQIITNSKLGGDNVFISPASGDVVIPLNMCFYVANAPSFQEQTEQPKVPTNWDFSLAVKSPDVTSITVKHAVVIIRQEM